MYQNPSQKLISHVQFTLKKQRPELPAQAQKCRRIQVTTYYRAYTLFVTMKTCSY